MLNFHFAVCDDDEIALSAIAGALRSVFEKNGVKIIVDTYMPNMNLFKALTETKYNAVFLDINMPKCDGIELGTKLKAFDANLDVIYVSSAEDRVFESLKMHPYTTPSSISVGFSLLEGAPTCYVYVPQEGVGQFYTDYFWGHYAGRVKGL